MAGDWVAPVSAVVGGVIGVVGASLTSRRQLGEAKRQRLEELYVLVMAHANAIIDRSRPSGADHLKMEFEHPGLRRESRPALPTEEEINLIEARLRAVGSIYVAAHYQMTTGFCHIVRSQTEDLREKLRVGRTPEALSSGVEEAIRQLEEEQSKTWTNASDSYKSLETAVRRELRTDSADTRFYKDLAEFLSRRRRKRRKANYPPPNPKSARRRTDEGPTSPQT